MCINELPQPLLEAVKQGMVIPAMPLALDANRRFDEKHQRALLRYYIDAGAGGIAVGVHSTQFEIRDPAIGLFEPVLSFASKEIDRHVERTGKPPVLKIAGVTGRTEQATQEALCARELGYHACLLSMKAFGDDDVPTMIEHCRRISEIMPLIGFYLQVPVGGRVLPYAFWRQFAEIDNVLAVKIAPFNRYQSLDVVRAVCDAGREKDIMLYTGNDDNIVNDLLTEYRIISNGTEKRTRIVGGLLGHWGVWTRAAVRLFEEIRCIRQKDTVPTEMLTRNIEVTDCNSAFFDAANGYAGVVPGIHEVLRRQGLLAGTWCLNPEETLSPGQKEEIDRVYAAYPHLNDDDFVSENLDRWFS